MNVFVDANVLITVLNKEYPRFDEAARFLSLSNKRKFSFLTSPLAMSICFYFSSKKSGDKLAYSKIKLLSERILLATNKSGDLVNVFKNKNIEDIEDGLEYLAAKNAKSKVIVSYDLGDFYFSDIEVLTPKDFMLKYAL